MQVQVSSPVRQHFILMGSPGSGKGTLADFLKTNNPEKYVHLSGGELYRREIDDNNPQPILNQDERAICKKNYLIGAPIPVAIFKKVFTTHVEQALMHNLNVIIDGTIVGQEFVEFFDTLLDSKDIKDKCHFVYVKVDAESAQNRLLGRKVCRTCDLSYQQETICKKCHGLLTKRADDQNEETVKNRISRFFTKNALLIDQYKNRPGYVEIDGTKSLAELYEVYNRLFLTA